MKYRSAAAFRMALNDRLQAQTRAAGGWVSLTRLRKMVVFDRLLARLLQVASDRWVLKGGFALDFRLGRHARSTKDLDLAYRDDATAATAALIAAQAVDLSDYFTFEIRRTDQLAALEGGAVRYHVRALLAGRLFDEVTIDVGFSDPLGWPPEVLPGTDLLGFAEIAPIAVPVLPAEQHLAERLHAYTRRYGRDAEEVSSRVKDLVDVVLIQHHIGLSAGRLRAALAGIFQGRGTHDLLAHLPPPPTDWAISYSRLAREVGIASALADGYALASACLEPILAGAISDTARWEPAQRRWVLIDDQASPPAAPPRPPPP